MKIFRTAKRAPRGPLTLHKGHYAVVEETGSKFLVLTREGQTAFPKENVVLGAITEMKSRRLTPQAGQRVFKLSETIVSPGGITGFLWGAIPSAFSRTQHVVVTPLPPGQEKLRRILLARLLQES